MITYYIRTNTDYNNNIVILAKAYWQIVLIFVLCTLTLKKVRWYEYHLLTEDQYGLNIAFKKYLHTTFQTPEKGTFFMCEEITWPYFTNTYFF